ncbi:unnamed protein product [Rhizopus microsporus]
MLQKNDLKVLLIDEFKTSSVCPDCEGKLEKFKRVTNPRPHKRQKHPTVICNGLLRCSNHQPNFENQKNVQTASPAPMQPHHSKEEGKILLHPTTKKQKFSPLKLSLK